MKTKTKSKLGAPQSASLFMLAPWGILFIIFMLIPVIAAFLLSFTYFDMLNFPSFSGFDNYIRVLLDDDIFTISLKNTLVIAVITGPVGYLASFVIAWCINEFNRGWRSLLTLCFYAPSLSGNVYIIWTYLFSGDSYGLINSMLIKYGIISSPIQFLTDAKYTMMVVIIVILWQSTGTGFLTFVAGLQGLNPELSEAGAIDGIRNRWQELWYITLPGMRNMLFFSAVMQIASAFSISNIVTTLAGYPTVGYAADTVVSYLTDIGSVRYEMGYASALSVVLFIVMFATRGITVKLLKKVGQ